MVNLTQLEAFSMCWTFINHQFTLHVKNYQLKTLKSTYYLLINLFLNAHRTLTVLVGGLSLGYKKMNILPKISNLTFYVNIMMTEPSPDPYTRSEKDPVAPPHNSNNPYSGFKGTL
jgi:hypothetical protein